jgi:hypothetical protein
MAGWTASNGFGEKMTREEQDRLKMDFARRMFGQGGPTGRGNSAVRKGKRKRGFADRSTTKPQECDQLGCHAEQVEEFRDLTKRMQLSGIEYRKDGSCHYTDEKQRDKLAKELGLYNGSTKLGA